VLAKDLLDIDIMQEGTPQVVVMQERSRPKAVATQVNTVPSVQSSDNDNTYGNSLKKEQLKQKEQKVKGSAAYRNDMCERLGRGC
jgi:hypothetical protein